MEGLARFTGWPPHLDLTRSDGSRILSALRTRSAGSTAGIRRRSGRTRRPSPGRPARAAPRRAGRPPPSALSQQISALERAVGTPVVRRSTRGVELTEAGRVLIETAATIAAELLTTEREIARPATTRVETLTVATVHHQRWAADPAARPDPFHRRAPRRRAHRDREGTGGEPAAGPLRRRRPGAGIPLRRAAGDPRRADRGPAHPTRPVPPRGRGHRPAPAHRPPGRRPAADPAGDVQALPATALATGRPATPEPGAAPLATGR